MKRILFTVFALALLAGNEAMAGEDKIGEAGFMFLKVPIGARETSLGLSGLTTTSGASALYWNPAGTSGMDNMSFQFSYLNYFAGISSNYFAAAFPIEEVGTFAASINYMSYGDIEITTIDRPQGTGSVYSPYDMAVTLGYSKQVTDRVSAGLAAKLIYSKIDQVSASGMAFDFGFVYNTQFNGLKLGFAMTNVGLQSKYQGDGLTFEDLRDEFGNQTVFWRLDTEPFELPASVNFGLSMDLFRNEQSAVVGMVEQNVNNLQANRSNFGLEYGFRDMFFLRGGYTSAFQKSVDYSVAGKTGGYSFGGGVSYKFGETSRVTLDYGYMNLGVFDSVHRFTVGVGL